MSAIKQMKMEQSIPPDFIVTKTVGCECGEQRGKMTNCSGVKKRRRKETQTWNRERESFYLFQHGYVIKKQ